MQARGFNENAPDVSECLPPHEEAEANDSFIARETRAQVNHPRRLNL
jgi:hypothetical protein